MNTTLKLTSASVKMFLRNRQALFFSFFTPLVIMVIFGYIGFDRAPKIEVGLAVQNPNSGTAQFVDQLEQFPAFTIHRGTADEERVELEKGNRSIVFELPSDFIPISRMPGDLKTMQVYVNAGEEVQARAALSIINQFLDKTTFVLSGVPTIFLVNEHVVNSHNLRYIEFLLPGLIALSIMQMSVFSVAFVFTQYKEKGVLKRLLATPMRPYQFVVANVITRLFVAFLQAATFLVLGLILFNAHVVGSYWLLSLSVVLGAIMFLGLGFTASGLSKTVDSVPAIANLVVFPMLFLGGTFFPLSSMPGWLQNIARFLPLTYFSTALRDVMTKGAGFWDIRFDLLGMFVWGAILIGISIYTFSFQEKEAG